MLLKLFFLFLSNQYLVLKLLLKLSLIELTKRTHCLVYINNRFDSFMSSDYLLLMFFVLLSFFLIFIIAVCSLEIVLVIKIVDILNNNFLFLKRLQGIRIHKIVKVCTQNKRVWKRSLSAYISAWVTRLWSWIYWILHLQTLILIFLKQSLRLLSINLQRRSVTLRKYRGVMIHQIWTLKCVMWLQKVPISNYCEIIILLRYHQAIVQIVNLIHSCYLCGAQYASVLTSKINKIIVASQPINFMHSLTGYNFILVVCWGQLIIGFLIVKVSLLLQL